MRVKINRHFLRMSIAGGILVAALAGCSTAKSSSGFPPPGAAVANGKPSDPPPSVNDCGVVSVGSPTKYVCNGKVYTTFQLSKMKKDYQAKQQAGN